MITRLPLIPTSAVEARVLSVPTKGALETSESTPVVSGTRDLQQSADSHNLLLPFLSSVSGIPRGTKRKYLNEAIIYCFCPSKHVRSFCL